MTTYQTDDLDPIQKLCRDLPKGWSVTIDCEQGAADLELYDPEGDYHELDKSDLTFDEMVELALKTALNRSED